MNFDTSALFEQLQQLNFVKRELQDAITALRSGQSLKGLDFESLEKALDLCDYQSPRYSIELDATLLALDTSTIIATLWKLFSEYPAIFSRIAYNLPTTHFVHWDVYLEKVMHGDWVILPEQEKEIYTALLEGNNVLGELFYTVCHKSRTSSYELSKNAQEFDNIRQHLTEHAKSTQALIKEIHVEDFDKLIPDLELSTRVKSCLRRGNIKTVMDLVETPEATLLQMRNMGVAGLEEIKVFLRSMGLSLES